MIADAQRYCWWLGARSESTHKVLSLAGSKLSLIGYRLLGRPTGALAWPLGLAFLLANADKELSGEEMPWIEHCFSGLVDMSGHSLLTGAHIDRCGLGYAALRLHELGGDNRYLNYALEMGTAVLAIPRAFNNLIPYTPGRQEILVDTLAFICPFLARLSRMTDRREFAQVALNQLDATWNYGLSSTNGWIYHGFDSRNMRPLGFAGWGRGEGWLLMAVVDTLLELPDGKDRDLWIKRGQDLIIRLEGCQKKDGHWPWRLDSQEEVSDSSVTSLVAYSLARWQQGHVKDRPSFANMLARCRSAIDDASDNSGHVLQCSGEATGIGRYSTRFGNYLWAQAPAVATDRICNHSNIQKQPFLA